jgi:hypothetical protein
LPLNQALNTSGYKYALAFIINAYGQKENYTDLMQGNIQEARKKLKVSTRYDFDLIKAGDVGCLVQELSADELCGNPVLIIVSVKYNN